jgi:hypothetical protein
MLRSAVELISVLKFIDLCGAREIRSNQLLLLMQGSEVNHMVMSVTPTVQLYE